VNGLNEKSQKEETSAKNTMISQSSDTIKQTPNK